MDAVTTGELQGAKIDTGIGRKRRFAPSRRTVAASVVAIAVAVGGAVWISSTPTSATTDDAYVGADATSIAPKVRGLVEQVLVRDNQVVRVGQPLVRIDPEEFDAKVAAAEGALADAQAGVASARADLVRLAAEERLASANVLAARTAIRSAVAQADLAGADRQRYAALVAGGAVAKRDADKFDTAAVSAQQDTARARALVTVSEETAGVTRSRRPGLEAAVQTAQAKVAQAQAALDLARQDRRHTVIVASVAGSVGNRQVRVGDYVQPGTRLLTLVPLHDLYVTANFKETQTARMHPGQAVTIRADALSGRDIHGRIESLAPGSGSSFALLPFEPGTGNFTKIVQRVPVRIRFDAGERNLEALRPGLSVNARVSLDR